MDTPASMEYAFKGNCQVHGSRVDRVASWCNNMNYDVHALMMQRAMQLELWRRKEENS